MLDTLINNFSVENLSSFFRQKMSTFRPNSENYENLFAEDDTVAQNYREITKIGDATFNNNEDVVVIAARVMSQLTSRTGKKKQYEIAKKILKEELKDAAFFVFYDEHGKFRLSFIRSNFYGTRRDFTSFKRFTYFVSPELTNKTFRRQISAANFNDPESVLEAFSVEPLTKEFYEKLQHWYFWALQNVRFPEDAEAERKGREIATIRLITRLIFIWFMKVRELIPEKLFDEDNIHNLLKDSSPEHSTYYKAILQNLFFATLNTEQSERKFRSETRGRKGYNPDYGNHNVYRYQDLFTDEAIMENLFSKVPFLNGGLFECLDYKAKDDEERKYIDGFTATKKHQPIVPNFLFFGQSHREDLSDFLNTGNQNQEVEGLIPLLKRYNFTIDENEPDDVEVALDPELLGSIFENLLASYNPETSTTARNATGSFYTPREIVHFMIGESLKEYLSIHLQKENVDELEQKLDSLISQNTTDNPFTPEESKAIIERINDLRMVDPAVGSGAFPMVMLNKLVFILGKLDPENNLWQEAQIEGVRKSISDPVLQNKLIEEINRRFAGRNADYGRKLYLIEKCIYGVDIQQIAVEIAKLRFFISLLVDEQIDLKATDDNCGIEPLPNLDFKLMQGNSLKSKYMGINFDGSSKNISNLLKEKTEQLKEEMRRRRDLQQRFIEAHNLKNGKELELKEKLVKCERKIQGLKKEIKQLQKEADAGEEEAIRVLIRKFEEFKNEYQNESDKKRKQALRAKIENTIIKIFEVKVSQSLQDAKEIENTAKLLKDETQRQAYIAGKTEDLSKRNGFDPEQAKKDLIAYTQGRKPKDFFLWDLYFAEVFSQKEGFDIVIGNPPYIQLQKAFDSRRKYADLYKNEGYETLERTGDIYALFYEKGMELLNGEGLLCYITSNKWMRAKYGKPLRGFLSKKTPLKLLDLGPGVFNTATVDTNILLIKNGETDTHRLNALTMKDKEQITRLTNNDYIVMTHLSGESWIILSPDEYRIKQRIEAVGTPLKDWDVSINYGIKTGFNEAFIIDGKKKDELIAADPKSAEIIKPILRGRDIKRYQVNFADLWLIFIPWHFPLHNDSSISGASSEAEMAFEEQYPALYNHLLAYKEKLSQRNKAETGIRYEWYALQRCAATYYKEFEKEKIVWKRIGSVIRFSYSTLNEYCLDSTVIATGEMVKYLTALLNSKLHVYQLLTNSPKTGTGDVIISVQALSPLSVFKPDKKILFVFETLVDFILFAKEHDLTTESETFEWVVDVLVYGLYFEEEMREADCYIFDRITEVIEPFGENDTDEDKIRYLKKFYSFCRNDKVVFHGLIHSRNVRPVKIITGGSDGQV